jgi:hypothetical protein
MLQRSQLITWERYGNYVFDVIKCLRISPVTSDAVQKTKIETIILNALELLTLFFGSLKERVLLNLGRKLTFRFGEP